MLITETKIGNEEEKQINQKQEEYVLERQRFLLESSLMTSRVTTTAWLYRRTVGLGVYLLKLLRDRGLQLPQLHTICQSLIVSRIGYTMHFRPGVDCFQLNSKDE